MDNPESKPGPFAGITLLDIAHAFEWSFDSDFEACASEEEVATREKFRGILSEALGKDVVPGDGLTDLTKALLGMDVPGGD